MYPGSKLTTAQPQRVFVGLRNFKTKIWKEIETCLRFSTYFRDRVLKKQETHISNIYPIGTLLHFLNFPAIIHMANGGTTSIIVCSIEWGKFGM